MYVKKWVAFASMLAAASLPAYGNSSISITSQPDSTFTEDGPAAKSGGCLLFRSTLHAVSADSNGFPMAKWDSSRPTEIKDQERTATLPEPGSGVLLTLGLLALFYLARTRHLIQEIRIQEN
jgi:hypothetical protein